MIIKHNNPCGAAVADELLEAYRSALACDPLSAFGGIVVLNRPVDLDRRAAVSEQFVEVLFAPGYEAGALDTLTAKPNVRILEDEERRMPLLGEKDIRQVTGGLLVQDRDALRARARGHGGGHRPPADRGRVGRPAVRLGDVPPRAVERDRARPRRRDGGHRRRPDEPRRRRAPGGREGAARGPRAAWCMASDAFFPFADGPALAIEAGVRAIIQPGGSKRDDEVVAAADAAGVAMVLTGRRHFRH